MMMLPADLQDISLFQLDSQYSASRTGTTGLAADSRPGYYPAPVDMSLTAEPTPKHDTAHSFIDLDRPEETKGSCATIDADPHTIVKTHSPSSTNCDAPMAYSPPSASPNATFDLAPNSSESLLMYPSAASGLHMDEIQCDCVYTSLHPHHGVPNANLSAIQPPHSFALDVQAAHSAPLPPSSSLLASNAYLDGASDASVGHYYSRQAARYSHEACYTYPSPAAIYSFPATFATENPATDVYTGWYYPGDRSIPPQPPPPPSSMSCCYMPPSTKRPSTSGDSSVDLHPPSSDHPPPLIPLAGAAPVSSPDTTVSASNGPHCSPSLMPVYGGPLGSSWHLSTTTPAFRQLSNQQLNSSSVADGCQRRSHPSTATTRTPVRAGGCAGTRRRSRRHRGTAHQKIGKLWQFLLALLHDRRYNPSVMRWEDYGRGQFKFVQSETVARMWGSRKGFQTNMTYEKLSRAMRYYYKPGILKPVMGRRLVYAFGPKTVWNKPPDYSL